MAKYQDGDIATFYFIVNESDDNHQIQAWTDSKGLAEFYMKFHNCKHFKLKSVTKPVEEIFKITEENVHDEIGIRNVITRKPDQNKGKKYKYISIPMTGTESMFISEECASYMSSIINYGYLDSAVPYLKKKYRQAFKDVLLMDIINLVVNNVESKTLPEIELDQVRMFINLFPEMFDK